jgi:hypothetical protein
MKVRSVRKFSIKLNPFRDNDIAKLKLNALLYAQHAYCGADSAKISRSRFRKNVAEQIPHKYCGADFAKTLRSKFRKNVAEQIPHKYCGTMFANYCENELGQYYTATEIKRKRCINHAFCT